MALENLFLQWVCLSLCFLVSSSEAALDHTHIRAQLRQTVTLECKAPTNTETIAVAWTRPDLEPDYILLYRDGHYNPEQQHPPSDECDIKGYECPSVSLCFFVVIVVVGVTITTTETIHTSLCC